MDLRRYFASWPSSANNALQKLDKRSPQEPTNCDFTDPPFIDPPTFIQAGCRKVSIIVHTRRSTTKCYRGPRNQVNLDVIIDGLDITQHRKDVWGNPIDVKIRERSIPTYVIEAVDYPRRVVIIASFGEIGNEWITSCRKVRCAKGNSNVIKTSGIGTIRLREHKC